MGRKKKKAEEQKPWCWYCDREFLDEPTLVQHQKNKHFKCPDCNRKLNTAQGLCVHAYQVHKRTITEIPAALPGREGVEREIFGMAGVPPGARPGNPFGDEGEPSAKKARTELAGSAPPPPLPPGVLQNGMGMSGPMGMGPAGHMGPGMGMPMPGHMGMVSGPMGGPPPPPMGVPPLGPPLPPPRPGFLGAPGMGLGGPPLPPPRPGFGPPGMGYGPPGMVPPPRGPPGAPVSGVPPPATVAPGGPPPPVPPVPPPGMMPAGAAGMGMVPPPGIRPPGGPLFPISGPSSAGPASSGPSSGGAPQQQPLFPVMGAPAAAGMPGAAPGALATAALVPAAAADGLQPHQQPPVAASEMRLVWADDEYSMEERRSMLPKYAAARQRAQQKGVGFNGPGIPPQHLQTAVASN